MKRKYLSLALAGLTIASLPVRSFAQCGAVAKHAAYSLHTGAANARFQLAAGVPQQEAQGELSREPTVRESIVGLWKMDFEDPADNYSDKGYQVWHGDHTEFMNSTRTPSVGAVCQGVWERVDESTFRLNHFALGYGDGVHLTLVYRIRELVTVDRSGDRISGTFSIEAFDPTTHAAQGTLRGTLTGARVKIDTGIDSQDF